jgi:hypothetical protein
MNRYFAMVVVAVALFRGVSLAQQTYSSATKAWSFTVPAGYQAMTQQQLDKMSEEFKQIMPDHQPRLVAAFIKKGGLFPYPRLLVQEVETDTSLLSWGAMGRILSTGRDNSTGAPAAVTIGDMVVISGAENYSIDQNQHAVSGHGNLGFEHIDVVTSSRAYLHSSGAVQLMAMENHVNAYNVDNVLKEFATSFKIAPGHEFVAAADKKARSSSAPSGAAMGGIYVGGGGAVIAVIAIIARLAIRSMAKG